MATESKIPTWVATVVLPACIALVPTIGGVYVTDYRLTELATKVGDLEGDLKAHERLPGHPLVVAQAGQLDSRLNKLDESTNEKLAKALSALSRLCGKLDVDCGI